MEIFSLDCRVVDVCLDGKALESLDRLNSSDVGKKVNRRGKRIRLQLYRKRRWTLEMESSDDHVLDDSLEK